MRLRTDRAREIIPSDHPGPRAGGSGAGELGMGSSLWGTKERPERAQHPLSVPALQRLRGTEDLAAELAELEEERVACQGLRAWRPWELFQDRTLRRQVVSLVVLGSAMELCGNDSVRSPGPAPCPLPPTPTPDWVLQAPGSQGRLQGARAPEPALCPPPQMYAYASSVFREAGIPPEKVQYAIIGTGCCELLTACISVSLALGWPPPAPGRGGIWDADTLRASGLFFKPFPTPGHC